MRPRRAKFIPSLLEQLCCAVLGSGRSLTLLWYVISMLSGTRRRKGRGTYTRQAEAHCQDCQGRGKSVVWVVLDWGCIHETSVHLVQSVHSYLPYPVWYIVGIVHCTLHGQLPVRDWHLMRQLVSVVFDEGNLYIVPAAGDTIRRWLG